MCVPRPGWAPEVKEIGLRNRDLFTELLPVGAVRLGDCATLVTMETPWLTDAGGLRRMRGSMDVVDAERLQGNEVAIVGLKRECIIFGIDEHYSIS
jgi:hypothetical protein